MKHEKDWIEWSAREPFPAQGTTINSRDLGICVVTETKITEGRRFIKVAFAPVVSAAAALGSIKSDAKAAAARRNGRQPKKRKTK
jgi:hypothetical protein